jgi:EmrB/QacA subfamily drug resistance transporter
LVLWTVLVGLFSIEVTFTVFVVAFPKVASELHTSVSTLTWVVTGPLLAFGVMAPVLGKASDLWGHRRLYLWGLAGGVVCAALTAVAPNVGTLIAVRTLEGLEGAACGAASMALIFQVFDRGDRVKAMGWWSLVGAGGPVVGVALGAPIIERVGWRWLFVGQIPLSLAALVLAAALLPSGRRGGVHRLDWLGAGTLALSVSALLFGLNRGPEWGWTSPRVLAAAIVVPAAAFAFVTVERRAAEPLIPLAYLRRRNFAFPIGVQVFANFAYMGGFILAPLLLERVYRLSEAHVGLVVIARPLAFSLSAPIAGYLAVRLGERTSVVAGALAVAASMLVFASLGPRSADLAIVGALVLSGVGLGVATPSVAASVANAVDDVDLGVASAAQQLMAQIGIVAGIQVMATIQVSAEASVGLIGSFRQAYLVGAIVSVGAVVCGAFVRRHHRHPTDPALATVSTR